MNVSQLRLILALALAFIGIGVFSYGEYSFKENLARNVAINSHLRSLQTDLFALQSELLKNTSILYYNYDKIDRQLQRLEREISQLQEDFKLCLHEYPKASSLLSRLETLFQDYQKKVHNYLTLSASLKNSFLYLPILQLRAFELFNASNSKERSILLILSKTNASIFMAKNAQDPDFLEEARRVLKTLHPLLKYFEGEKRELLFAFSHHLEHFLSTFPSYAQEMDHLLHHPLLLLGRQLSISFQKESRIELARVKQISRLLLFLLILSLALVIYYIFALQRENRNLLRLKRSLEQTLRTDALTKLPNRYAFLEKKDRLQNPCLLLINIDRFKHINELYGTYLADKVLQLFASRLQKLLSNIFPNAQLYRMGGDDFGILFEKTSNPKPLEKLIENLQKSFRPCRIVVEGVAIDLALSLGGSCNQEWLFETADMALKEAKHSHSERYAIYSKKIDKRSEIQKNIHTLRLLYEALEADRVLPYFQPIYDTRRQKITRYEALARIQLENGEILQPHQFIHIAQESKLSIEITLKILEKVLLLAEEKPYIFSVNLSAPEITLEKSRKKILHLLHRYRNNAQKITFEILESEEIEDYELVARFIHEIKSYGLHIALDDFGSGYSNFEKILRLEIDILKIDGSLIQNLDKDHYNELAVQNILNLSKLLHWETVAEFVHSEAVARKLLDLGCDMLQGYYLGKPEPFLQSKLPKNLQTPK